MRVTPSDDSEALLLTVFTQHTLCPLLTGVPDDSRGNGHARFEYPRMQCSCLLPPVQLASLLDQQKRRGREGLEPLARKPLTRWPGGGVGRKAKGD